MRPKNGVRKPAQKSVALTVASPVHVNRPQANHNRCGVLFTSPGEAEDSTSSGVGVGGHVGCNINDVMSCSLALAWSAWVVVR